MKMGFVKFESLCSYSSVLVVIVSLCVVEKCNARNWKKRGLESCELFDGNWIYDESHYPLYNASSCPFIEEQFDCQKNGRPNTNYQKYRWKPKDCELPRFDGRDLLKRLKGKRILFVGDSLSLNQWQSLTCMLHVSVPQSNYTLHRTGDLSTFLLPEYHVSLTLSRNAFLVDLVQEKIGLVLKLDSIENGNSWKGYDIIIFNSWHWWLHKGHSKPWSYIQEGSKIEKDMNRFIAYRTALRTWSKWVDSTLDSKLTKVFFQGISPTHYRFKDLNSKKASTCKGQSRPIKGSRYVNVSSSSNGPVRIVKQVLAKMSKSVTLLDITKLSELRKDGHPSLYGNNGIRGNDCSHWCLAGVPDTWNQLFYTMLLLHP